MFFAGMKFGDSPKTPRAPVDSVDSGVKGSSYGAAMTQLSPTATPTKLEDVAVAVKHAPTREEVLEVHQDLVASLNAAARALTSGQHTSFKAEDLRRARESMLTLQDTLEANGYLQPPTL